MVTRLILTPWQDHEELLLVMKELFWSRNGKDLDKRRKACSHVRFEMRLIYRRIRSLGCLLIMSQPGLHVEEARESPSQNRIDCVPDRCRPPR